MLWGCFLGLQLGKSRFPRCSAPYFAIFAVQVRTSYIASASWAQIRQQLHSSCPHHCVQSCTVSGAAHERALRCSTCLQCQLEVCEYIVLWLVMLQAALSLAANVLFTYQARRAAAAAARQASAQPMLRPQVPPYDPIILTLSPGNVGCRCCHRIQLAWRTDASPACRAQLAWPAAMH